MSNKDKNQNTNIDAIAEMWARLILAQLQTKNQQTVQIPTNENKNKYE